MIRTTASSGLSGGLVERRCHRLRTTKHTHRTFWWLYHQQYYYYLILSCRSHLASRCAKQSCPYWSLYPELHYNPETANHANLYSIDGLSEVPGFWAAENGLQSTQKSRSGECAQSAMLYQWLTLQARKQYTKRVIVLCYIDVPIAFVRVYRKVLTGRLGDSNFRAFFDRLNECREQVENVENYDVFLFVNGILEKLLTFSVASVKFRE